MSRLVREAGYLARFTTIGAVSTCVHLTVAVILTGGFAIDVQIAHLTAFLTALGVSFFGHYRFTFKSRGRYGPVLIRFLSIMVSAYAASAGCLFVLAGLDLLPGTWNVIISALCIPIISYIAGRFWVF